MADLRSELVALVWRAEADGSQVIAIRAIRQLLDHDAAQANTDHHTTITDAKARQP